MASCTAAQAAADVTTRAPAPVDTLPPGSFTVLATALIALLLTLVLGFLVDLAVVMAHEGSHALVTAVFGIPVRGIVMKGNEGGTIRDDAGPLSIVPIKMAGYLGPSAFGLLGCVALSHGRHDVVLWGSVVLLLLLLGFTDNWTGRVSVALVAAALAAAAYRPSPSLHVWVSCVWVWVLLLGGLRTALQHRTRGKDHLDLRDITQLPTGLWGGLAVLGSAVAAGYGGLVMLGIVTIGG